MFMRFNRRKNKKEDIANDKDSIINDNDNVINDNIKDYNKIPVEKSLHSNVKTVKKALEYSPDLVIRTIKLENVKSEIVVMYLDGLADSRNIEKNVIQPILKKFYKKKPDEKNYDGNVIEKPISIEELKNSILSVSELKETATVNECIAGILAGDTVLFIDNVNKALVINSPGWPTRMPEEPTTEASVIGPRDGFVETLRDNIVMVRRRIKDHNLSIIKLKLGRRTSTDVAIAYIKGIANRDIVKEVVSRVEKIDVDEIIEAGTIMQFIEDNFLSPFPQMQYTERPDRVVAALIEGRIAILVDNTPFVLIAPASLPMFLQTPEDYYERWIYTSLIRFLRYLVIMIALFLPGIYVALISYHQGLIPTKLAIFIAATREGVPVPSLIEAILMEVTLEILREAGIRLPKTVGQAVGIVGGLVVGEAAVRAGLVSAVYVVIVALTGIASFSMAQYPFGIPLRILRFVIILAAGVLGLYGVMLSFIILTVHLVKLKSFGVNYLSPYIPYRPADWKDFLFRAPVMGMKKRPEMLKTEDKNRQSN